MITGIVLVLIVSIIRYRQIRGRQLAYDVVLTDRLANFYGLSSLGPGQIRGNGSLALTREGLLFEMYLPAKILSIPLDAILKVDTSRTHLGKTGKAGSSLLRVTYTARQQEEVAAWRVNDVQRWVRALSDDMHM